MKRTAWGYTAQIGGQQVRCFHEEWSKDDAERALAARKLGLEPPAPSPAVAGITLGQMIDKFLAEKRSEGKRSIQDDEERSAPLRAFFGSTTPLAEITTRRVAEYRIARQGTKSRRGAKLSPTTVNRECALLRSVLRMAFAWGELARLPAFKMAKERRRERFLAEDEITRLLAACAESRNELLLPMVTVALHTGLRLGELLGLTWERVDFARGVIPLGKRTKSGKSRDVPMNSIVYAALAPLRSDAGGVDATGPVWRTADAAVGHTIDTAFSNAVTKAKILANDDGEAVTFHTLRHTFASHYVMKGGRLEDLQVILGHSSISTTQIYRHFAPDHLRGATAILEGLGTSEISAPSTHGPSQRDSAARGVS